LRRFSKACATVRCFMTLLAIVFNRLGAISETVFPPNHLSDQNRMCSPLPTMDYTAALKRAWAFWGIWIGNPAQGQELSVLSSQSYLMRRDHPKYSRSWTPSPPCCRGILSRFQEIRQISTIRFFLTDPQEFPPLINCFNHPLRPCSFS
jgi:hypothetical protein